jgi:hypothetical protein
VWAALARDSVARYDPGDLFPSLFGPRLLGVLFVVFLSPLCGVSFRQSFEGTETFKSIAIEGDRVVDSPLKLSIEVTQTYPVPLQVTCYYEDATKLTDDQKRVAFQERAAIIGQALLPPAPEHRPQDKLDKSQRQTLSFDFKVPESGQYFAACITPAAAENGYGLVFRIKDAS